MWGVDETSVSLSQRKCVRENPNMIEAALLITGFALLGWFFPEA